MEEAESANQRVPARRQRLPIKGARREWAETIRSCRLGRGGRRDSQERRWELRLPLSTPFLSCLSFPGNER